MRKEKILVTDDDPSITRVVGMALEEAGYQVQLAANGLEGLQQLYRWQPDLVILDVMMPRMDGWLTCQRIREVSDVPIMILTAMEGETNEVNGLHVGADLYMTKPFALSVLVARVEAILRRSRIATGTSRRNSLRTGQLEIDLSKHEVTRDGEPIDLSPTEFRLLAALATRPGEVVSHRELLTQVWGPEYVSEDLYLKLYICYLRQKIERDPSHPRYIITKRGVGYYLNDASPDEESRAEKRASKRTLTMPLWFSKEVQA